MKQMPTLPSANPSDASVNPDASLTLDTPVHVENDKPEIINPENDNASVVTAPIIPRQGIEVVATAKGFYNQNRITVDQKFYVKSFDALGEWMVCTDPVMEKKRIEMLKQKKKAK